MAKKRQQRKFNKRTGELKGLKAPELHFRCMEVTVPEALECNEIDNEAIGFEDPCDYSDLVTLAETLERGFLFIRRGVDNGKDA